MEQVMRGTVTFDGIVFETQVLEIAPERFQAILGAADRDQADSLATTLKPCMDLAARSTYFNKADVPAGWSWKSDSFLTQEEAAEHLHQFLAAANEAITERHELGHH